MQIKTFSPNFMQTTVVTFIYATGLRSDARRIHIGHLNEMHYVSALHNLLLSKILVREQMGN